MNSTELQTLQTLKIATFAKIDLPKRNFRYFLNTLNDISIISLNSRTHGQHTAHQLCIYTYISSHFHVIIASHFFPLVSLSRYLPRTVQPPLIKCLSQIKLCYTRNRYQTIRIIIIFFHTQFDISHQRFWPAHGTIQPK